MIRASLLACMTAAGVFAVDACGGPAHAQSPFEGAVTVSGNHLLRDGAIWVPHGVVLTAFEAGPSARPTEQVFRNAFEHYTPGEFLAIRAWGADSVRIQVAQPAVDRRDPEFKAEFLETMVHAVRAARAVGLTVVVSIQDEPQSGEQPNLIARLPNLATLRVWLELAPRFNDDEGILYEILNEPQLLPDPGPHPNPTAPDPADWAAWKAAMETVIEAIRSTGSRNVVVADGLAYAATLDGAPQIRDARNRVAYAMHPYFVTGIENDAVGWTRRFGNFARTAPVLATEWNTSSTNGCSNQTQFIALDFLRYIQAAGIGLYGYGYDFATPGFGSIVRSLEFGLPNPPTTYVNQSCAVDQGVLSVTPNYGPGTVVQDWYRTGSVPWRPQ